MMQTDHAQSKTGKMVRLAILTAILLILAFTPLGYLTISPTLKISFLTIPVAIGAIVMGPAAGAFLGLVFGLTAFSTCFGADPFGAILLGINPVGIFLTCIVPRVLMGWLVGVIFLALHKIDTTKILSFGVASISAALLNTLFFMGFLWAFFGKTDIVTQITNGSSNFFVILVVMAGTNALVEAVACCLVGAAVSKPLYSSFSSNKKA